MRYFIECQGHSIQLQPGETVVGREIGCQIRFNDAAVSRRHLRFRLQDGTLTAEDLGSANGSWLNGQPLAREAQLSDGDELRVGSRRLRVVAMDEQIPADELATERDGLAARVRRLTPDAVAMDAALSDENRLGPLRAQTLALPGIAESLAALSDGPAALEGRAAGELAGPFAPQPGPFAPQAGPFAAQTEGPAPAPGSASVSALPRPVGALDLRAHNCPRCRKLLPMELEICSQCGYLFRAGRPLSVTQRIRLRDLDFDSTSQERRADARVPVDIPALYASETLSFDASALDLSMGGAFIASELLEAVGTRCQLTLLPDAAPALFFSGVVAHAVDGKVSGGQRHVPGMGIRFLQMGAEAARWLRQQLGRRAG